MTLEEEQGAAEIIEIIQRNAADVELRMQREIDVYKKALQEITELEMSNTRGPMFSYYMLRHTAATALIDGTRIIEDFLGW